MLRQTVLSDNDFPKYSRAYVAMYIMVVLRLDSNQMQTRADAEIVVYSVENQKPGHPSYEAQNDRQENSQGCPE